MSTIKKCFFPIVGYGTQTLSAIKAILKGAPSNLVIIGRYILTPDIFDILSETKPGKSGEIQIIDALLQQAKEGRVLAYKFQGKRFDCGSVDGFVEATNYFYKKSNK